MASNREPQTSAIPVHLITGLLGSGKTTLLQKLIQQKPPHENWGVLINEFGDIDIDSTILASSDNDITLSSVAGGCICCTAQLGLSKALDQLLTQHPLDRIFIEPTGLGHPARVIDTLKQSRFAHPILLQPIICIMTASQLTLERWHKSQVMRDLANLADIIALNKMDQATADNLTEARECLALCYPEKTKIIETEYGNLSLQTLTITDGTVGFTPLTTRTEINGAHLTEITHQQWPSQLNGCIQSRQQTDPQQQTLYAAGWQFSPKIQFNRVKLNQFFSEIGSRLIRAKGVLRTGNEWQLVQISDTSQSAVSASYSDIAWRQDSRLELLFEPTPKMDAQNWFYQLEQQLSACIAERP